MHQFRRTMQEKEQKLAYHAPQYYETLSNPTNALRNTEEYKDDRKTVDNGFSMKNRDELSENP